MKIIQKTSVLLQPRIDRALIAKLRVRSCRELAAAAGVHPSMISAWLSGRSPMLVDKARKALAVVGEGVN